jgi:Predicted hydrolases or acyltransferases (alpha/beta hydrolase superfamily)
MERAMTDYRKSRVRVPGGALAVGTWNPDAGGTPVLAVHGITASHLEWPLIAARLPGARVIAPDLRGRGRSNGLPAPWGMRDHADDLARLLDALGVERAVIVGHSMGGFVAVRTANQHPDRIASLVLVDGGLPLPFTPPSEVPAEEIPALLLGPAGERLSRVYPSREAYREFWREHPAFRDHWNDAVAAYVDYDLDEVDGGFRPSSRFDAIATNVMQMSGDDGYREALAGVRVPIDFLRAPRGLLNETPGLYPDALLAAVRELVPRMRMHDIIDVNHYTIVMTDAGADQVAPFIRRAVETGSQHEEVVG